MVVEPGLASGGLGTCTDSPDPAAEKQTLWGSARAGQEAVDTSVKTQRQEEARAAPTAAVTELCGNLPVYSHGTAGHVGRSKIREGDVFNIALHSAQRECMCLASHSREGSPGHGPAWSHRGTHMLWPGPDVAVGICSRSTVC